MRLHLHAVLVIAGASMVAAPAASAGDVVDPLLVPVVAAAAAQLPTAPAQSDALLAPPVATDTLDELRGGDGTTTTLNISDVDGNVSGNTANNTVSGVNRVDGGSFSNSAGLSTVIQNSGNNVLIQNSTVVSIQFAPKP